MYTDSGFEVLLMFLAQHVRWNFYMW